MRRLLLAMVLATGLVAGAAVPGQAGELIVSVAGVASCNPQTGEYTIDWAITVETSGTPTVQAVQTPPGQELTVTPNPFPGGGGVGTAQSTLPGDVVGQVDLTVNIVGGGGPFTGSVQLAGCTLAVEGVPAFTG